LAESFPLVIWQLSAQTPFFLDSRAGGRSWFVFEVELLECHFATEVCQGRPHTVLKLLEADLGISIHVESAEDCNEILFGSNVAHASEESFQIVRVDIIVTPVVDCFECLLEREVVRIFQVALHFVSSALQPDFLKYKLTHSPFDSHWQIFMSWKIVTWSL
jgi:hypothetical protein